MLQCTAMHMFGCRLLTAAVCKNIHACMAPCVWSPYRSTHLRQVEPSHTQFTLCRVVFWCFCLLIKLTQPKQLCHRKLLPMPVTKSPFLLPKDSKPKLTQSWQQAKASGFWQEYLPQTKMARRHISDYCHSHLFNIQCPGWVLMPVNTMHSCCQEVMPKAE